MHYLSTRPAGPLVLLAASALFAVRPALAGPLEVEGEDLKPGLVAVYRSLPDPAATLVRIEPKPALRWGLSSPHPRLPAGPLEVTWIGALSVKEAVPISFDAFLCGELSVEVDGVTVLEGRGDRETARVEGKQALALRPGHYPLKIRYRSSEGLPARLQIGWRAPTFAHEPLPAWHLKHLAADVPSTGAKDLLAGQGRAAVGRFGCARCHARAFPGVTDPPPGPALVDLPHRIRRNWLLDWLANPSQVRPDARMPALFAPDRQGFVERWLVAEHLLGAAPAIPPPAAVAGDHRAGRLAFISLGCASCHPLPDLTDAEQPALDRYPFRGIADRLPPEALAGFLIDPHTRYPDGRMPRLPIPPATARDIAAYLLLWSKPTADRPAVEPAADEVRQVVRQLGARDRAAAGAALVRAKRCAACHPGLEPAAPGDVPLNATDEQRGCLSGRTLPRFAVENVTRRAIATYHEVAGLEKHPSAVEARRRLLERAGCARCHQRDGNRPPPLEVAGSTLGGGFLQALPYQRTPRLTYPHQKYTAAHLLAAVRDGVTGLRPARYTYRMPAFGLDAEALVQALAEADGELPDGPEPTPRPQPDPTLGPLAGPLLAGFQGYGCVSCHLWNGQSLSEPDPGAVGPDLTRTAGRIRRDWFDRFLEDPARSHPGTPMPTVFPHGKPATLSSVLDGDPIRQKDALWNYFALGRDAPNPKPPPPLPITPGGTEPLVAQVPLRFPDRQVMESICVLYGSHDLFVYDLGSLSLHGVYTGAQLLRDVQGRLRRYSATGTPAEVGFRNRPGVQLLGGTKPETPTDLAFQGYDLLADGVRLRWQAKFASGVVEVAESLRLVTEGGRRRLVQERWVRGIPANRSLEWRLRLPTPIELKSDAGTALLRNPASPDDPRLVLSPAPDGTAAVTFRWELPEPRSPPRFEPMVRPDPAPAEGSLERPGYRALAYPRPKTVSGEDRVMPAALAVNPRTGRVFVSSLKTGEIFALDDPGDDGHAARFDDYAHGLFQEALSMHAEGDALYVLHRRNLTRITESRGDGHADRFDRVAALPHGLADTYDYAYGLVRDRTGAFVISYAPYANTQLPGSGAALRLSPGKEPREIAFGFRNPLGWCNGPEGEVFFTDNQGEWVPTNKICHLVEGRFFGFPNPAQRQHTAKPPGKTAVWIPYGWARSINGVAYDNSAGKFGPFAGQFFLAELMFGGAIVRACVEKVNGEYQGACFPFWGKGLLGPLTLAFDPRGRLFVGGITEPGWMAQPDRGALFRLDFTGPTPFEIRSIHVRPRGFRLVFTTPVDPNSARDPSAYPLEHYRYEYTGAYGSPELDRTPVAVERVELAADGLSVDLTTASLVKDRVYLVGARGVRSVKGEALVHPVGAYTLNEIPSGKE